MNALFLSLLRALTTPDGADGVLLTSDRKSHLLEAGWYRQLATEGEREHRASNPSAPQPSPTLLRSR
jgi:hypothetical protein